MVMSSRGQLNHGFRSAVGPDLGGWDAWKTAQGIRGVSGNLDRALPGVFAKF